ncbi:hypothetical protein HGT73_01160 [Rosenbergiella australiborealis]|uniref:Uncharacterized protein n=1 Tax=Rosenbergiella australiborealis TaxID=1544696 RepID=A0ABS5T0Y6_9GAMM|nr:hypothetical protein [Rosenbergiella australiborealis]MBT0726001.1 hypothetical protein [Rosenbergiella australiborealis]
MTGQQKKYVFRELVKNRTDAPQLISYAIYKSHKDERAEFFHANFGEALVPKKLQEWHDSVANDFQWLDTYRSKADLLIKEIEIQAVQNAMPDINLAHQGAITALENAHKIEVDELQQRALDAEKKAREEWAVKTNDWAVNQTKPGWWKRNSLALLKVIGGSVISVLGGAIATACIVGLLAIINPTLSATANSLAKGLVDKLLPADDPTGLGVKSFTHEQPPADNDKKP